MKINKMLVVGLMGLAFGVIPSMEAVVTLTINNRTNETCQFYVVYSNGIHMPEIHENAFVVKKGKSFRVPAAGPGRMKIDANIGTRRFTSDDYVDVGDNQAFSWDITRDRNGKAICIPTPRPGRPGV